jgi:hypothetical protein
MNTPPPTQQASRTSTGALSQQPTLVPSISHFPSEAFKKALDEFRTRLSADELCQFKNTTYEQLLDDLKILQKKQEKIKEMKNLNRIQSFLEGMNQIGKTIEVFLNVHQAVFFIWGPVKFLLLVRLSKEFSVHANECIRQLAPSVILSTYCSRLMRKLEIPYLCSPSMSHCLETIRT